MSFLDSVGNFFNNIGSGFMHIFDTGAQTVNHLFDKAGDIGQAVVHEVGGVAQTTTKSIGDVSSNLSKGVGSLIGSPFLLPALIVGAIVVLKFL